MIRSIALLVCVAGMSQGNTMFYSTSTTTSMSGNNIYVGGHQISVETQPVPKLYVDNKKIDLSTAGSTNNGTDYTLYSNFPGLPGISIKYFNNGGYNVIYEHDGVTSKFGTLSPEEQKRINDHIQNSMNQFNQQMAQYQQNMNNMMQSLGSMFTQPWFAPFPNFG